MNYARETLDAAYRHTSNHRAEVEGSTSCGCFYCLETFESAEIVHWLSEGSGTALCPNCCIDSIIGSASGYAATDAAFLKAMHERWFSVTT